VDYLRLNRECQWKKNWRFKISRIFTRWWLKIILLGRSLCKVNENCLNYYEIQRNCVIVFGIYKLIHIIYVKKSMKINQFLSKTFTKFINSFKIMVKRPSITLIFMISMSILTFPSVLVKKFFWNIAWSKNFKVHFLNFLRGKFLPYDIKTPTRILWNCRAFKDLHFLYICFFISPYLVSNLVKKPLKKEPKITSKKLQKFDKKTWPMTWPKIPNMLCIGVVYPIYKISSANCFYRPIT